MKKLSLLLYVAFVLGMAACSDNADKNPEANTAPVENTAPPATPPADPPAEAKKEVEINKKDTARTSISIGEKGGSVKTKKGTEVSVDQQGVKVGTGDVDIKIGRDSN